MADLQDRIKGLTRELRLRARQPSEKALRLPADSRYRFVRIEQQDFDGVYVLPCWDWFLDTGRTFALTETLVHLQNGRGGVIGGQHTTIDHQRTVEAKIPYIKDYDPETADEHLILVATDEDGPYTLIDGTHRAAALLSEHQRSPNAPWNAILIESPRMATYQWHIASTHAPGISRGLTELANQGVIW